MRVRPRLALGVALATTVGGVTAGVLAAVSAVNALDVGVGLLVRAALVAVMLLVVPALVVRRRVLADRRGTLVVSGLTGLTLGYALNPFAWSGRAFLAQLMVDPGPLAVAVDLAAWLAVGAVGLVAATRSAVRKDEPVGYRS